VNIQWTYITARRPHHTALRKRSGNIQGTFRKRSGKHSGQVEVDAREPQSQLQEALKESTKVKETLSEHSGQVEVDAREPQSQLQQAL